jgi:hypothetical protein
VPSEPSLQRRNIEDQLASREFSSSMNCELFDGAV